MRLSGFVLAAAVSLAALPAFAAEYLTIQLKDGPVVIELETEKAPRHAERLKELAAAGAYDNVAFHRVIEGFMAQTGDVKYGNMASKDFDLSYAGMGGSDKPDLKAEFSPIPFERGVVGMARSQSKDSANSQFFIMFNANSNLNNQYTVVGKVVSGMENVDKIKRGSQFANGAVKDPDRMIKVTVGKP